MDVRAYALSVVFLSGSLLSGTESPLWQIIIDTSSYQAQCAQLENLIKEPKVISHLTYGSDTSMSQEEFAYLTDLHPGMLINAERLRRAIFYLCKKERFSHITFIAYQEHEHTLRLECKLTGKWILDTLKVKGFFVNRHQYAQLYLVAPGGPFEETLHHQSCARIRQALISQGYYQARLTSTLTYDETHKTVEVLIHIERGPQFTIETIEVVLTSPVQTQEPQRITTLTQRIRTLFMSNLLQATYDKRRITKETRAIKKFLIQKGYVETIIHLKERLNHHTHTVSLFFTIELHQKKKFSFVGNHFFSHSQLTEILQYERTWMLPAAMRVTEIENAYKNAGFYFVCVQAEETDECMKFIISEGPRAHIEQVVLEKVTQFDSDFLVENFCTPITQARYGDKKIITQACQSLIAHYQAHGFLDATIEQIQYVQSSEPEQALLVITIKEEKPTYIGSLRVLTPDGTSISLPNQTLSSPLFNMNYITEQTNTILQTYQSQYDFSLITKPRFTRTDSYINIEWPLERQPTACIIGKTVVQEPCVIPYTHFLKLAPYRDGNVYSLGIVRTMNDRLNRLNIFSNAQAVLDSSDFLANERAIIINAQQNNRFEVRTRLGGAFCNVASWNSPIGFTYAVGGTIIGHQIAMNGDTATLEMDISKIYRLLKINYRNPWLWNEPLNTEIEGFSTCYQQPGIYDSLPYIYQLHQSGIMGYIAREWDYWKVECTAQLETMRITLCGYPTYRLAHALVAAPSTLNCRHVRLQLESACTFQQVDNPLLPTKGLYTCLALTGAAALSSTHCNMAKIMGEAIWYAPIERLEKLVCALRLKVGHIFAPTRLDKVLLPDRFYLGGAHSVRSYPPYMSPPLGLFVNTKNECAYVPQGARSMALASLEMRFPLYKLVGATLFQDVGILSNNFHSFRSITPVIATGIGLWYATPIGPVRFEIGYPWRHHPGLPRATWCLTIGFAF